MSRPTNTQTETKALSSFTAETLAPASISTGSAAHFSQEPKTVEDLKEKIAKDLARYEVAEDFNPAEAANFAARSVLSSVKSDLVGIVMEEARKPLGTTDYVRVFDAMSAYVLVSRAQDHLFRSYIEKGF